MWSATSILSVRPTDSPETKYIQSRIEAMGGALPNRSVKRIDIQAPALEVFHDALGGSRGREASTTSAFVSILKTLMKDPATGKLVVPDHPR